MPKTIRGSQKKGIDYAIVRARVEAGEFGSDLATEYGVSRAAISKGIYKAGYVPKVGRTTKAKGRNKGSPLSSISSLRDGVTGGADSFPLSVSAAFSRSHEV